MADKYIIAYDIGTSGCKAVIVSVYGEIIDSVKKTYPLYYPEPGFAEQDPLEMWDAIAESTREVMHKALIKPADITGITFSSQVQSLIPINHNGEPLMQVMTWLDVRSAKIINKKLWHQPRIFGYNIFHLLNFLRITGGCPGHTGKDQIGKMLWLQEFEPEIAAKTYKYLDVKDFIIFKLTENIVTSVDVAYVWWLLDTRNNHNKWHSKLCKIAGISTDQLAEVKESADIVGQLTNEAAEKIGLMPGTYVLNGAGDLSSAALGSGAINEGELHIRVGTSGGVAGHFSKRKIDLAHYAGCIGSTYPSRYYLGIAHQETAGLCLEWLKTKVLYHEEQLKQEVNVEDIYQLFDKLASEATPGSQGLMFTPWMFGERCPLDNDYIRAGLYNINLNHTRKDIIRAVFEGIGYNTRWAMETLERLYHRVDQLNIIGGGAKSDIWCQIIADITNRTINQVENPHEASAKGVALLASMTLGHIGSYSEIKNYIKIKNQFYPNFTNRTLYDESFKEFKNLYRQNKKWHARMNKI